MCWGFEISISLLCFQGYEGVRESNKKNPALTVKSVDSNMNKKNKKKKEEEIELPSKKIKNLQHRMPDSSSTLRIFVINILTQTIFT